jgi:glycosyltransferase involved in cell wall biosynthesis
MLISVYIPTKNRAGLLASAVESVRGQTYRNLELIVVDDGSVDDTPALLASLARQEPRLRVIRNDRSLGGAAARNLAIRNAQGMFVTGLDDDDRFTPDRLQSFVDAWSRHEGSGGRLAGLYSQISVVVNGAIVEQTRKPRTVVFEDMFRENLVGNQIYAPKRNFLDAGLFNIGLPAWQDLEFFMRMLKVCGPAHLVDAATYVWDDSVRADRISLKGEEKIRLAFNAVLALHAEGDRRRMRHLYSQLFRYGVRPTRQDIEKFTTLGMSAQGLFRMIRASVIHYTGPTGIVRNCMRVFRG